MTEISSLCHWCHDMKLLSGGFEPNRLSERWTPEELVELRRLAAALRDRLLSEASLRVAARRQAKSERERKEDGQGALV